MTKTHIAHQYGHQLDHLAQKLQLQHLQASRTSSGKNGDRGVYIIYRDNPITSITHESDKSKELRPFPFFQKNFPIQNFLYPPFCANTFSGNGIFSFQPTDGFFPLV